MGYYKNMEIFSHIEEPDRKEMRLLSSKLITLTVREYLTVMIGLSVSCIVNVVFIIAIARLLSV